MNVCICDRRHNFGDYWRVIRRFCAVGRSLDLKKE